MTTKHITYALFAATIVIAGIVLAVFLSRRPSTPPPSQATTAPPVVTATPPTTTPQPTTPPSPPPGDDEPPPLDAAAKKMLVDTATEIETMERAARRATHAFTPACMTRANAQWKKVEAIAKRLGDKPLDWPGMFDLKAAASDLHNCVSCSDDYAKSCDEVKRRVAIARREMQ